MTRSAFTERKVIETLLGQGAVIPCFRCRLAFTQADVKTIEREHIQEMALGGENTPENCAFSHAACHARITNGSPATSAGGSKHRIAKAKRLAGGKKKRRGRSLTSPYLMRKVDGTVVRREAR